MESSARIQPTISIQNTCVPESVHLNRTQSKESVATDLSLNSCIDTKLSLIGLQQAQPQAHNQAHHNHMEHKSPGLRVSFRCFESRQARGPSPSPHLSDRLLVPIPTNHRASSPTGKSVKDIWLDEENDLIRSCGALSKALGLQKSFSTSDILTSPETAVLLKQSRSEMCLLESTHIQWTKLEANSRSLSTWVAVGDVQSSTSQLPSPQVELSRGFPEPDYGAHFTAADLVRSVNKKVRQNYIRRRLKVTYKALEQLSESEFDLDKLEVALRRTKGQTKDVAGDRKASSCPGKSPVTNAMETVNSELAGLSDVSKRADAVSPKEIERDRGKPISKFERNIMIFDWLHTLDETATVHHDLA